MQRFPWSSPVTTDETGHNESSNLYTHQSLADSSTYNYGTLVDRLPPTSYLGASGGMEAPPRPQLLFIGTSVAEPTYSGLTLGPFTTVPSADASKLSASQPSRRLQGTRTQRKAASEWAKNKPVMEDFYLKQNKNLEQLRELMKNKYQFEATPKQYKTQFTTWGWAKYFTHDLALYMNDKHKRRVQEGKSASEFVWRNQRLTVGDAQKLLTEEELEKGETEILNIPTPFGVTVETPQSAPSPAIPPPDKSHGTARITSKEPKSFIRLRWKGHTIRDLDTIREVAHQLEIDDNIDGASEKYLELLDVSAHLLLTATDESSGLAYEVAGFFARNDDMEKADQVLDNLSADFVQRWGSAHERTLKHFGIVSKLLAQWDRHADAVDVLKRLTNDFSTSTVDFHQEQPSQAHTPRSITSRTYLNVSNSLMEDSVGFVKNNNENTSLSSFFAVLSEQIDIDRAVDLDDEDSPDRVITRLLQAVEKDPKKNAADIIRLKYLLVKFYVKVGKTDESMETLTVAKNRVLSMCNPQCCLPKDFFHPSIDLAKALLDSKQENEANNLLERLQEKFTDQYEEDSIDTISFLIRIGKMFQQVKRWDLARARFETAYAAVITRLGIDSLLAKKLEESLEKEVYSFDVETDDDSSFFHSISV